jgi:hypothetical protein
MGGVIKKDQLLQMYQVERKRMNKLYMKLFRRLLSATVRNSLIICKKTVGWNVDHFKFRINVMKNLLVKHSMQCKVSGRRGEDSSIKK